MPDYGERESNFTERLQRIETASDFRKLYEDWLIKRAYVDTMIDDDVQGLDSHNPDDVKFREALRLVHFSEYLTKLCFPRMMESPDDLRVQLVQSKDFLGRYIHVGDNARVEIEKNFILRQKGKYKNNGLEFEFGDEGMAWIISVGVHEIAHQFNPKTEQIEDYAKTEERLSEIRDKYEKLSESKDNELFLKDLENKFDKEIVKIWAIYIRKAFDKATSYKREKAKKLVSNHE